MALKPSNDFLNEDEKQMPSLGLIFAAAQRLSQDVPGYLLKSTTLMYRFPRLFCIPHLRKAILGEKVKIFIASLPVF